MNVIWNEDELKKIRNILQKINFDFDESYKIFHTNRNFISANYLKKEQPELEKIFYLSDKKEIFNILKLTIPIRYKVKQNPSNKIFLGLITSLSKLDPTDATSIFIIFKEIVTQYIKVSNEVASLIVSNLKDPNLIRNKIDEIKESNKETKEEEYIKKYIRIVFSHTNGITEKEIFKDLIDKCNSNIKSKLVFDINRKLIVLEETNRNIYNSDFNNYVSNGIDKRRKKANNKHN